MHGWKGFVLSRWRVRFFPRHADQSVPKYPGLQASAHQIAVLLIFNDTDSIAFADILKVTGCEDKEYMQKVMATLVKTKLVKERRGSSGENG